MPTSCDRSRTAGRHHSGDGKCRFLLLVHCGAAVLSAAAGAVCLGQFSASTGPDFLLAPAGILFVLCSAAQARLLQFGWRSGELAHGHSPLDRVTFWRTLAAGMFIAYLAALAVGPLRSIGWAWGAMVTGWYTVLLLPLATSQGVLASWRKWSQQRRPRRLNWLVYASLLLVAAAEGTLQVAAWATRPAVPTDADFVALRTVGARPGVAELDGLDLHMTELRDGHFRVAIVGEASAVRGVWQQDGMARMQQSLPGLDFVALVTDRGWSTSPFDRLPRQLADCRPDLVLAVVSVCDEMARTEVQRSWFDWRNFALGRLLASPARDEMREVSSIETAGCYESFLNSVAPQLQAMRIPVSADVQVRWQRMFASLDALALTCIDQQLPVAIVVVPGQFQVSPELLRTLARRTGCPAEQLDADLPQRRLAGYAARRELPLIDLLPYLRMARGPVYQANAPGLNERGNAVAASALSGWLQSRYGGPLAVAAQLSISP